MVGAPSPSVTPLLAEASASALLLEICTFHPPVTTLSTSVSAGVLRQIVGPRLVFRIPLAHVLVRVLLLEMP